MPGSELKDISGHETVRIARSGVDSLGLISKPICAQASIGRQSPNQLHEEI